MSTPRAALLAVTLALAGCGTPADTPAPAAAPALATAVLPAAPTAPTAVTVPGDVAQVVLRLGGTLGDVDLLTAEVTPAASPDEARRWPVDAAPEAGDGAAASITLPAYALPPGDYTATVWEGDATVVQKYRFRVAR